MAGVWSSGKATARGSSNLRAGQGWTGAGQALVLLLRVGTVLNTLPAKLLYPEGSGFLKLSSVLSKQGDEVSPHHPARVVPGQT